MQISRAKRHLARNSMRALSPWFLTPRVKIRCYRILFLNLLILGLFFMTQPCESNLNGNSYICIALKLWIHGIQLLYLHLLPWFSIIEFDVNVQKVLIIWKYEMKNLRRQLDSNLHSWLAGQGEKNWYLTYGIIFANIFENSSELSIC